MRLGRLRTEASFRRFNSEWAGQNSGNRDGTTRPVIPAEVIRRVCRGCTVTSAPAAGQVEDRLRPLSRYRGLVG